MDVTSSTNVSSVTIIPFNVTGGMWNKNKKDIGFELGPVFARKADPNLTPINMEASIDIFLSCSLEDIRSDSVCRSKGVQNLKMMKEYVRPKLDC